MIKRLLPAVAILFLAGCKTIPVESNWATQPFTIDGDDSEWKSNALRMEKQGIFLSVQNDQNYLYIGLAPTSHRLQAEMVRNGLTIWFGPDGSKRKKFGVRYPIGFEGSPLLSPDSDEFRKRMGSSLAELDLLGPERFDIYRVPVKSAPDVVARINHHDGRLVYEIRVPLSKSAGSGYGISEAPFQTLMIGFEIATPDVGSSGRPGEGGFGMGGGGGTGRKGVGPPGGAGGKSEPRSLDLWIDVKMAKLSADAPSAP